MSWRLRHLNIANRTWVLTPGTDLYLVDAGREPVVADPPAGQARQARITWHEGRPVLIGLNPNAPVSLDGNPLTAPTYLRPGVIAAQGIRLALEQVEDAPAPTPAAPAPEVRPAPASTAPAAPVVRPRRSRRLYAGLAGGVSVILCVALVGTAVLATSLMGRDNSAAQTAASPTRPAATAGSGQPSPEELTLKALRETLTEPLDPYRIHNETKAPCGQPVPSVLPAPERLTTLGARTQLYVDDEPRSMRLRYITDNADFYVEDGVAVDAGRLVETATFFQQQVYGPLQQTFGELKLQELGADPHMMIVFARMPEHDGGFFRPQDMYPRSISPTSNERPAIYLNASLFQSNLFDVRGVLAHEFQHLIHFQQRYGSDAWINEGASEVAFRLVGIDYSDRIRQFMSQNDVQLNHWNGGRAYDDLTVSHYAAAALFLTYLSERYGGTGILKELMALPGNGEQQINAWLARHAPGQTFDSLFTDWMVTNAVNDRAAGDGRFAYNDFRGRHAAERIHRKPGQDQNNVPHYAARHVELAPDAVGTYELRFRGSPRTRLLPTSPRGKYVWWSNTGDMTSTSLSRTFDLTGAQKATLQTALWHDLDLSSEAAIEVSTDGGCTWKTVRGQNTRGEGDETYTYQQSSGGNPPGQWLDEVTDLSAYAGQKIQVRYRFHGGLYLERSGFAIGRVAVPELNFTDDLGSDNGWEAKGFVRVVNDLPEKWLVRLVKYERGGQVTVSDIPLSDDQSATVKLPEMGVGGQIERAVLVFAAATPRTFEAAHYQYNFAKIA